MSRTPPARRADWFFHCQRDVAERRVVHRAVVFIGPRGGGKNAVDAEADFRFRLLLPDYSGQPARNFFAALGKILFNVEEHLRPVVRPRLSPAFRFSPSFDTV